jgi:hypothetical protein
MAKTSLDNRQEKNFFEAEGMRHLSIAFGLSIGYL